MPWRAVFLTFLSLALCGCSSSLTPSTDYDGNSARNALVEALDAWKAGQARSLATRTPPIRLVDDDFRAGLALVDYEVLDSSVFQPAYDVPVRLVLKNRRGESLERNATFQVVVHPNLSVMRTDL